MESSNKQSAKGFIGRISNLAHTAAGKPVPETTKESVPLVPIYIGVDRDHEQLREMFLYRHGDKQWSVKPAASRFLLETSLPGNLEKTVQDQITAGLKPYRDWQDPGQEQLVALQLYARLNDQVFRDELLWDVSNPQNTPDTYAMRVCGDLGLGCDWYDVIKGHLEMRLQEVRQDLKEAPEDVQLQQPGEAALAAFTAQQQQQQQDAQSSTAAAVGVPRVEHYDAANDVEASRVAARQQVLEIRQNKKQQAAAAAGQQQQQQQQRGQEAAHPAALPQQLSSPQAAQQQQQQQNPAGATSSQQQQQQQPAMPVLQQQQQQQPTPQQQQQPAMPMLQQQQQPQQQQQQQPVPQQMLPTLPHPTMQQQGQQHQQQHQLLQAQQRVAHMQQPTQQQQQQQPQPQVLQQLPQMQQPQQQQQQQPPHMQLPAPLPTQMTPQQIQQLQQQLMQQQQQRR